jgi:hypothetical protein
VNIAKAKLGMTCEVQLRYCQQSPTQQLHFGTEPTGCSETRFFIQIQGIQDCVKKRKVITNNMKFWDELIAYDMDRIEKDSSRTCLPSRCLATINMQIYNLI